MSLVHRGASFRLFSPCVYNFLCGMDAADLIAGIEEVPECSVREVLKQVKSLSIREPYSYYSYCVINFIIG